MVPHFYGAAGECRETGSLIGSRTNSGRLGLLLRRSAKRDIDSFDLNVEPEQPRCKLLQVSAVARRAKS